MTSCGNAKECVPLSECPHTKQKMKEAAETTDFIDKFNLLKSINELICGKGSEAMVCCEKDNQDISYQESNFHLLNQ